MRIIKKVLSFALITAMAVTMTACGGSSKESKNDNKIVIRYQKSIAYAPVMIILIRFQTVSFGFTRK